MKIVVKILIVPVLLLSTGCGTFIMRTGGYSPTKEELPYPASRVELNIIKKGFKDGVVDGWTGNTLSEPGRFLYVIGGTVGLPFSAVVDTLCLPWDLKDKKRQELRDAEIEKTKSNQSTHSITASGGSE